MSIVLTKPIRGAGGGGAGAQSAAPVRAPNTLRSRTTGRVQFLLGRGENGGLFDQTNPLKSIYFNNVPVMNADGSLNNNDVRIEERFGLPDQLAMDGFPSQANTVTLAQKITTASPRSYTASNANVDAIRITIRFPALFEQATNGDTTGSEVQFRIMRQLGSGAFSQVGSNIVKRDKCIAPADLDYMVPRPNPGATGPWTIKVERITADNTLDTKANDIYLQRVAELQNATTPEELETIKYNGYAYIGVTATSETTGSTWPTISFDYQYAKIKVPSNYNVATRTYTGEWNGLFKPTKEVCNNPAWVLYDILTEPGSGMGTIIAESDVDKWSFYEAAKYCDEPVPALVNGSISGTEPRFTFNHVFTEVQDSWTLVQNVAATFQAAVFTSGNYVRLVQDRPTGFSRLITDSNVIGGAFEVIGTSKTSRYTACIVRWNDPAQNGLSVPCYYEDETASATILGVRVKEVTALGVWSEGQAMRLAKWHVETSLYNTDTLTFKVSYANAGLEPGEVIKVMNTADAGVLQEARVVSSTSSSLTLDKPITVASGNTLDVLASGVDPVAIVSRTITSTGTLSTINFSGAAIPCNPGDVVAITGAVSPRLYKVVQVKLDEPGIWAVSAAEYDPNKFGRVDNTPTGPTPIYQAPSTIPSAPLNLNFHEAAVNRDNVIQHSLTVSWSRPANGNADYYSFGWRRSNGDWQTVRTAGTSYTIENALAGVYDVRVYAQSPKDVSGPTATGSYTLSFNSTGDASALNAPTSLGEFTTGGTAFTYNDLIFKWTNPTSNGAVANTTLKDFEVRFVELTGGTTVRTVYVPSVIPGGTQSFTYSYTMNLADGGPRRSIQVQVRCRDTKSNLSSPITATFTNAAPATPTGLSVVGGLQSVKLTFTPPTERDIDGFYVWGSTTSGFTPSAGNLLYTGADTYISFSTLSDSTTYYYKVAAYDTFSKPQDGTGLNLSAQLSATTSGAPGVAKGPTNPGTGIEGDVFFNTTDGKLYRYHAGAWTAAVPSTDITGQMSASQLAAIEASKITGQVSDSQIAAMAASKVTGQLVDAQIAAMGAGKLTGQIVGTQITDNAVTAPKIAGGTITGDKIAGSTIAGSNIIGGTITGGLIAADAITATHIQANAVGASEIQANSITASKLVLTTQPVTSVWPDANFGDTSGWSQAPWGTFPTQMTITDGKAGGTCFYNATNGASAYGTRRVPLTIGKRYKLSGWARKSAGTDGTLYIRWNVGTVETSGYTEVAGTIEGVSPPTSWTYYSTEWVATYPYASPMVLVNHVATSGWMQAQDIRIEEMVEAALIVDGTITGAKIAADTITATQIAANAIGASELAANSVVAGKVAAATIGASEVIAGSLTGDRLVANTITGDKIAANTVTATNINSNGLLIRDNSGNVILGAGNALAIGYAASGTVNSAISIGSNGALSGAGGGQVTIGGLGYSGDLNATNGATLGSNLKNQAGQAIATIGGGNLFKNGDFRLHDGVRPSGISDYSWQVNQSWWMNSSGGALAGSPYWVINATSNVSANWGFQVLSAGVSGGWPISINHVISFYAAANGGMVGQTMNMAWNTTPDEVTWLENPPLSGSWQRYAVKLRRVSTGDSWFFYVWGALASNVLIVSNLKVEVGDVVTGWDLQGVNAANQINGGNVSTYIANTAIGSAQIGTLTAGNLTVSALSNTINGSTSSGGRVEIQSNKILVYDTSNVQRVKMGYLL